MRLGAMRGVLEVARARSATSQAQTESNNVLDTIVWN